MRRKLVDFIEDSKLFTKKKQMPCCSKLNIGYEIKVVEADNT